MDVLIENGAIIAYRTKLRLSYKTADVRATRRELYRPWVRGVPAT